MARLITRRRKPRLIFVVVMVLVLVVLVIGDLVLHWPDWMLRVWSLLLSLSALVMALTNPAPDGSKHG